MATKSVAAQTARQSVRCTDGVIPNEFSNRIVSLCLHPATRVQCFPDAVLSYDFLTRASGLPKLSQFTIKFVGMRPPSEPLAVFTPRDSRGRSRLPSSYADTDFIDGCV